MLEISTSIRDLYSPPQPPPKSKVIENTPQSPGELPPNQPQKFFAVPEVQKMTKVLEDGRENW